MSRRDETEEERRIRKEKERAERGRREETEEERRIRKEKERAERGRREETEEERRIRKEKERAERGRREETEEERRIRKEKERAERGRREETEEERRIRKEKERAERGHREETEEERRIRKEKERAERGGPREETEEERRIRKEKERAERGRREETEEERRIRKEKERAERGREETEEERRIRKEKERAERGRREETEEERRIRKEKERAERKEREEREREDKAKREVVHKPLRPVSPQAAASPQAEKKIQGQPPPKAKKEEEEDDYGYGDDFEDEVFDESELEKVSAAVNEENRRLAAQKASSNQPTEPQYQGQARVGLDQDSLARNKHKQQFEKDLVRATALRRLVDLDEVKFTMTDFAPMSQYDMFIRNFGGVARQQMGIQAPAEEDMIDTEVQAERVHMKNKKCQAPNDLGLFPEKQALIQKVSAGTDAAGDNENSNKDGDQRQNRNAFEKRQVDTAALGSFLSRVFPVMRMLLDESEVSRNPAQKKEATSQTNFTSTVTAFQSPLAEGRPPVKVSFSQLSPQYLVVAHGKPAYDAAAETDPVAKAARPFKGLALLWNINDPSRPDKVLVSHSKLTDICFSPTKSHLIYGGTEAGTVCVWDTREPDSTHTVVQKQALRIPSYSTDWHQTDNHFGPVKRILVAGYNAAFKSRGVDETEQLMSLDSSGALHFWMVSETSDGGGSTSHSDGGSSPTRARVISDTDYGQNIMSRVRLFKASAINTLEDVRLKSSQVRSEGGGSSSSSALTQKVQYATMSDMEVSPADPSHLLIGSTNGVLHVSKFGSITAPSAYLSESSPQYGSVGASVQCLSACPTDSRLLLAGYDDGSVRLFVRDDAKPQLSMSLSVHAIVKVRWTFNRRWLAFLIDSAGQFFAVDLATSTRTTPVVKDQLKMSAGEPSRFGGGCVSFSVSKEERPETRLAFGFERGGVEVHLFKDSVLAPPAQRQDNWL